jgi:hypothetical protein
MSRIKFKEAMEHVGLARDSFDKWCIAVRIKAYDYEFSTRRYFLKGEFFAKADAKLIQRLMDMHGENWGKYYEHFTDVKAFLQIESNTNENITPSYTPVNAEVRNFLNQLRA